MQSSNWSDRYQRQRLRAFASFFLFIELTAVVSCFIASFPDPNLFVYIQAFSCQHSKVWSLRQQAGQSHPRSGNVEKKLWLATANESIVKQSLMMISSRDGKYLCVYHRPNTSKYLSVYKCGNRVYPRSKVHFWQDNLSCTFIAAFLCQTQADLNV